MFKVGDKVTSDLYPEWDGKELFVVEVTVYGSIFCSPYNKLHPRHDVDKGSLCFYSGSLKLVGQEETKEMFKPGDKVKYLTEDDLVPRGTVGTVIEQRGKTVEVDFGVYSSGFNVQYWEIELVSDTLESKTEEGMKLPWEAADSITLACLKEHYQMAKDELDNQYFKGEYLHREDVEGQAVLMNHLKAVIEYFGTECFDKRFG